MRCETPKVAAVVILGHQHEEDDSTTYYVHTSTPHLHDISVSGPCHSRDAISHQMMRHFGTQCSQGRETVIDRRADGTLAAIEHITSPIESDQNRTRTCRIIREDNAAMKARLPGTAYVVVSTYVDKELAESGVHAAVPGTAPVQEMDVHGTSPDEASAVARARVVAQGIAGQIPNSQMVERGAGNGMLYHFAVAGRDNVFPIVIVKLDNRSIS